MFELLKQLLALDAEADAPEDSGAEERPSPAPASEFAAAARGSDQSKTLDTLQGIGDVVGVFDQTGISDLANSLVSLLRGARSDEPEDRKRHFVDAGIRAVSAIPFVGDFAKVGRTGRYMTETENLVSAGRAWSKSGKQADAAFEFGNAAQSMSRGAAPALTPHAIAPARTMTAQPRMDQNRLSRILGYFRGNPAESDPASPEWKPPHQREQTFLDKVIGYQPQQDPKLAYFFGDEEYRREQRHDRSSPFYDYQEVLDDRYRKKGFETEEARARRRERKRGERLHQEFLADPGMDVSQRTPRVQERKEEFDRQRQQLLEEQMRERQEKIVDTLGQFSKALSGAVAAVFTLPPAVSKFGESLIEARRMTAIYDGHSAAKLAQLDVQRIMLDQRLARNTSQSTGWGFDMQKMFREEYQPVRERWQNFGNRMGGISSGIGYGAAWVQNRMFDALDAIAENSEAIRFVVDWWFKSKDLAGDGDQTRGRRFGRALANPGAGRHTGNREPLPPLQ